MCGKGGGIVIDPADLGQTGAGLSGSLLGERMDRGQCSTLVNPGLAIGLEGGDPIDKIDRSSFCGQNESVLLLQKELTTGQTIDG